MMMLWAWAGVPLGVYNIVEEFNIALRIQPQILIVLSLVTWIQCYYYEKVVLFYVFECTTDADCIIEMVCLSLIGTRRPHYVPYGRCASRAHLRSSPRKGAGS